MSALAYHFYFTLQGLTVSAAESVCLGRCTGTGGIFTLFRIIHGFSLFGPNSNYLIRMRDQRFEVISSGIAMAAICLGIESTEADHLLLTTKVLVSSATWGA